ncbi:unnamed protein product [Leuciscus chuanchicus]
MISLAQEDVQQLLEELFQSISHELPSQAVPEATDQTTRLLFKLFDREQTGVILLRSVEAALIVLCGDSLSAKQKALFRLAESYSGNQESNRGSISRSALRVLLDDLSQVPAVVQENHVFGHAETAVSSCFKGVIRADVSEEHFISWLQSEPRLLLWLSTLYRISVSEAVQHRVHCHVCKAFPITGLRYRCVKCLNVHLCQSCFLTERRTRKHKPSHPVLEYCTQPSWKESIASLASSARHALVPRHTRREAERKRALRTGSRYTFCVCFFAPSPVLQFVEDPDMHNAPEINLSASPAAVTVESKALQTEEIEIPQSKTTDLQKDLSVTQKAMRDLQRDKWLLEKEFQVWRVAAQSEHDSLEDKCTELKTMMETLNQNNQHLEDELDRVRHVLSRRDRDEPRIDFHSHSDLQPEHDDSISENDWTQPGCLKPLDSSSGEEEIEKERGGIEVEEETLYEVSEDISTNLDDTDSVLNQDVQTASGQQEEFEEEGLQEEQEEVLLERQDLFLFHQSMSDLALEEHSGSDDSQMDDEEELCELKEMLMTAAEGVRDTVSHLVTSVRTTSLA